MSWGWLGRHDREAIPHGDPMNDGLSSPPALGPFLEMKEADAGRASRRGLLRQPFQDQRQGRILPDQARHPDHSGRRRDRPDRFGRWRERWHVCFPM
jgi:hypothetical protein